MIRDGGRDGGRQGLGLPVHDEENLVVAVEVGFYHGDGGAGDAENRCPQPLPDYLTTPPSDKPKFAGADVPLETPLDPLEAGGVRHFVRQNVSGGVENTGNLVDLRGITRCQWCRVKVMLYH